MNYRNAYPPIKRIYKIPVRDARNSMLHVGMPLEYIDILLEEDNEPDRQIFKKGHKYFIVLFNSENVRHALEYDICKGWGWEQYLPSYIKECKKRGYVYEGIVNIRKEKINKIMKNNKLL
jgi:hypothetical protein